MRRSGESKSFQYPRFKVRTTESLLPDDKKAGDIFSRLGYRFADAIADLVDNSVDAKAKHVLVRFVRMPDGVHSVIIADDGHGMNAQELREAMRFGSRIRKTEKNLGKYGIGLKSASLSQAEIVTVLSKKGSRFSGRRWVLKNIKKKWTCEILSDESISPAFRTNFGDVRIGRSGTIIIWEHLEHLRALPQNLDKVLKNEIDELCVELGIRFHRFIENKKLSIAIDQQFAGESEPEIQRSVTALNPFSYSTSGRSDYPLTLHLEMSGEKVAAECHIWPPKSSSPGYRLGGGKVALRQGFYFYRNDRVIQAGGWNRIRADDGEPHLSLARVQVDLPAALDSLFKLDVTKSHLDPAPKFIQALMSAKTKEMTFQKYLDDAERVYRKQKKIERAKFPFVPGKGLPARARKAIAGVLNEHGTGRPRLVTFKWTELDLDEVVRVDAENAVISLNSQLRDSLVEGGKRDAPVLKMALMFLMQGQLEKVHKTQKATEWVQRVNLALIAALKDS